MEYINIAQRKRILSANFDAAIDKAWPIIFEHADQVQGKLDRVYWISSYSDEDELHFVLGSSKDPYAANSPIIGFFKIDETISQVASRLKVDDWEAFEQKVDNWYFDAIVTSWNKFSSHSDFNLKKLSCFATDSRQKLEVRAFKLLCGPKRKFVTNLGEDLKEFCFTLGVIAETALVFKNNKLHEINLANPMTFPLIEPKLANHVRKLGKLLANTNTPKFIDLPKDVHVDGKILEEFERSFPLAKIRRLTIKQHSDLRDKLANDYLFGKRKYSFDPNKEAGSPVSDKKASTKKTAKKKVVKKTKATRKKK